MKRALLLSFVLGVGILGLMGCVSAASTEPTPPAPERILIDDLADQHPDKAILVFYRKAGFGSLLNTSVYIDDVEIADLDNKTYIVVAVEPGEHRLHSDEAGNAFTVSVEAGRQDYYRIIVQSGVWKGHGVLHRMDLDQGRGEFHHLRNDLKPAKDVRQPDMVISG